jgi:hypothetical protein
LRNVGIATGLIFCCVALLAGCETEKKAPPPLEKAILSPYPGVHTLAIAPALNLSGSRYVDVLAVSDSLFAEMQQVSGLNVLPLNRTLFAMRQLNIPAIDTPAEAQRIAESLGADGLIVPAITAYDPYNPPVIGMILQNYTPRAPGEAFAASDGMGPSRQPVSQAAAIFNATNQTVLRELRDFAAGRTQYDSALADDKFLMDADLYMRFVSHAMVRRLMEAEKERLAAVKDARLAGR